MSYILLLCAFGFQVNEDHHRLIPTNTFWMLLLFAIFEFATSAIIAQDSQKSFTYLIVYLEYLVTFYLIRRYSENDQNVHFSVNAFVILTFLMALTTFFRGSEIYSRLSISESTNVNSVGVVMMFGIGLALYRFIRAKKNAKTIIALILFLLPCIYILVLTVSKKAIIGTAALLVGWMIICYGKAFSKMNFFVRLLIIALFIGIGYYAYVWFTTTQANTYQYILYRFNSINDLSAERSSGERLALIREGLKIFSDHPVLGVGYNNYRYYSNIGLYSHCFYIEILACTGITGTLIFMIPLSSSFAKYMPLIKRAKNHDSWAAIEAKYFLFIFLVLLVLSWTQIIFYEFTLMYVLSLLISFVETYYLESHEESVRYGEVL
jgi:O-antigen ligase